MWRCVLARRRVLLARWRVLRAAVEGGRVVTCDADRVRIVEHLGGGGAPDSVDQQFEGGLLPRGGLHARFSL
ncbi:hypothetical protein GA0115252_140111 [Streptomyces sp. DfronAA-171]|nr:hypothetical protein GA0115252_140111 [Streptomyces sp. DfronAA-171]